MSDAEIMLRANERHFNSMKWVLALLFSVLYISLAYNFWSVRGQITHLRETVESCHDR